MTTLTHYFELKAIPQAELTQSQVVSTLFESLHRELIAYEGRIGLSFPGYGLQRSVGGIIRIFGNEEDIRALDQSIHRLSQFADYALITNIAEIPDKVEGYYCFGRLRQKGKSAIKRAKARLISRNEWNDETAERIVKKWEQPRKEPFLVIKSQSTGESFSFWIGKRRVKEESKGEFGSYGLSSTTTVPHF